MNDERIVMGTLVARQCITGDIPTTLNATGGVSVPKFIGGEEYNGEYEVIPATEPQILPTANKTLFENVTVQEIPTYSVSNDKGTTFIIGG